MKRRNFLLALSGMGMAATVRAYAGVWNSGKVSVVKFSDDGKMLGHATLDQVHNDADWKRRLSPLAYRVTREQGTERAFSQPGYDNHAPGLYRCICCDNALFDAKTKYDSGTGWPSFWQPIAKENVQETVDRSLGMRRVEVQCTLCDAHLGHVFDDGPKPTGLRYCMNTVALRFIPYSR